MSSIVERLRAEATDNRRYEVSGTLATEAADRIAQLEADAKETDGEFATLSNNLGNALLRIEQLEAALRPLACTCKAAHQADCSRSEVDCPFWNARAALEERT